MCIKDFYLLLKIQVTQTNTICVVLQVLESSEAALQVAMQAEDTAESFTPGHSTSNIMKVLKKIDERSSEVSV